jgi:hypothetical protein
LTHISHLDRIYIIPKKLITPVLHIIIAHGSNKSY